MQRQEDMLNSLCVKQTDVGEHELTHVQIICQLVTQLLTK